MKWLLAAVSLAVAVTPRSAMAQAKRDPGSEVRGVFAAKCAGCHGSNLPQPKGRFGYVLDLRRVASNPEMVVPSQPDESELWVLVQRKEMPPADSPHGPLTSAEQEIIRSWIAAGAPDIASEVATGDIQPTAEPESQATPVEMSVVARTLRWLGKFHLLLLHFPIAIVLVALVGEVASAWRGHTEPSAPVRFCIWLAAIAAIPTAILGWLHAAAGNGVTSPQLLMAHRWVGTTTAIWLVVAAMCVEADARRGVRRRVVSLVLLAGALLTALTAHLGGLLAHGADFFDW